MGSPIAPNAEQYAQLEAASQLAPMDGPGHAARREGPGLAAASPCPARRCRSSCSSGEGIASRDPLENRRPRRACDRHQLPGPPDAARGHPGHRARHPGHERAVLAAAVGVPDRLRPHVRRGRQADGRPGHAPGLHGHHGVLVPRLRQPRAGRERRHARRQPVPARHRRRRRLPGRDAGRGGVVPGRGALHGDGHHQRRHRRRHGRGAAADRAGAERRGLALVFFLTGGPRPCCGRSGGSRDYFPPERHPRLGDAERREIQSVLGAASAREAGAALAGPAALSRRPGAS